jgi:hypothetical protein
MSTPVWSGSRLGAEEGARARRRGRGAARRCSAASWPGARCSARARSSCWGVEVVAAAEARKDEVVADVVGSW